MSGRLDSERFMYTMTPDASEETKEHWARHIDGHGNWKRLTPSRCCYCAVLLGTPMPHRHPEDA